MSACLPLLRPLFTTRFPTSPATFVARILQSFSGSANRSSQPRNFHSEDQSPIEGPNKIFALEKGFRNTPNPNVAARHRQQTMSTRSYSKHKTWCSATISTIDGDVERILAKGTRDDDAISDLEGNPKFSDSELQSTYSANPRWERSWQHEVLSPVSGYGRCGGRRDTYNLMPSIARWDRGSIIISRQ